MGHKFGAVMTIAEKKDCYIKIPVTNSVKESFEGRCASKGQKVAERARQLIINDLNEVTAPVSRFDQIMTAADIKTKSSGVNDLSLEDIDQFISEVRAERIAESKLA